MTTPDNPFSFTDAQQKGDLKTRPQAEPSPVLQPASPSAPKRRRGRPKQMPKPTVTPGFTTFVKVLALLKDQPIAERRLIVEALKLWLE